MKNRAGELHQALEQAGFDLSKGGLSFGADGQGSGRGLAQQQQQQQNQDQGSWRGRAFQTAAEAADDRLAAAAENALRQRRNDASGVDIRI